MNGDEHFGILGLRLGDVIYHIETGTPAMIASGNGTPDNGGTWIRFLEEPNRNIMTLAAANRRLVQGVAATNEDPWHAWHYRGHRLRDLMRNAVTEKGSIMTITNDPIDISALEAIEHYQRYPCYRPFIGNRYADGSSRRLLVIGESHYLQENATAHLDPEVWYAGYQNTLAPAEIEWCHTAGVISGSMAEAFKPKAHRIYAEIAWVCDEIGECRDGHDQKMRAFDRIAFMNFFQRPAQTGVSLHVQQRDIDVAQITLRQVLHALRPELIAIVSSLAARYAESVVQEWDASWITVPHPGCAWWSRRSGKLEGRNGYEAFKEFLLANGWHIQS